MIPTVQDVYLADVEAQRRLASLDRATVPIVAELIDGALCLWRTNGEGSHTDTIRIPPGMFPIIGSVLHGARSSALRVRGGNLSIRAVEGGISEADQIQLNRLTTAHPSTGYLMARSLAGIERETPPPVTPDVRVRITTTPAEYREARDLTDRIFRNRQGPYDPASDFHSAPSLLPQVAAFLNGHVVAAASFLIVDGIAIIWSVCTEPAYRRRGLASAVVQAACEQARRCGAHTAGLGTSDDLAGVGGLYHRLGFRVVGHEFGWTIHDLDSDSPRSPLDAGT